MKLEETIGKYYYLRDYDTIGGRVNKVLNMVIRVDRIIEEKGLAECSCHLFTRKTEDNHLHCYIGNIYEDFKGVEKYEEFKEITAEEYDRIAERMLKLCDTTFTLITDAE